MAKLTTLDEEQQPQVVSQSRSSWWQYGRQLLKGTMILGAGFLGYVLLRGSWFSGEENTAANDANADLLRGSYSRMSTWLSADVEIPDLSKALGSRQLFAASPRTGEFVITQSFCSHPLEFIVADSATDDAVRIMRRQCGDYSYQTFLINTVGDIESMMIIPWSNATRIQAGLNLDNGFLISWSSVDEIGDKSDGLWIRYYTDNTESAYSDSFGFIPSGYAVHDNPQFLNIMFTPTGNNNHTFVLVSGVELTYMREYGPPGRRGASNVLDARQYDISNGEMALQFYQMLSDGYIGDDTCDYYYAAGYGNNSSEFGYSYNVINDGFFIGFGGVSCLTHLSDGSVVVVWRDMRPPNLENSWTTGIYAQMIKPEGVNIAPIFIGNSMVYNYRMEDIVSGEGIEAELKQNSPAVATLTTGEFIVVWEDVMEIRRSPTSIFDSGLRYLNTILARRYNSEGREQSGIFQVNACLENAIAPQVIGTETGYLITWYYFDSDSSPSSSYQVVGQRYDFTDHKVGDEFYITKFFSDDSNRWTKRATVTLSGNPFLLWQTKENTLKGRILSDESDFSESSICISYPYNATGLILVILGGLVLSGAGVWGYRSCYSARHRKLTEGAISTELQEQEEEQEEASGVDVTAKTQLGIP